MAERKTEYLLLALIGLAMVLVAIYTQWISMDLRRYSVAIYLDNDINKWYWWDSVSVPFIAGCVYIGAAFIGMRSRLAGNAAIIFFLGCFAFGTALALMVGIGSFAAISCALILAYVILKHRKHSDA